MNETGAYSDWISLYDDAVYDIWKKEPNEGLRKISMMLFVVRREFEKNLRTTSCELNLPPALDSPELFQNDHREKPYNLDEDSVVISDDDEFQNLPEAKCGSPEINKGRRAHRLRMNRFSQSPSLLFLNGLGITSTASPSKKSKISEDVNTEELIRDSSINKSISVLDKNISYFSYETPVRRSMDNSKNESFDLIPSTPITPAPRSMLSLKHDTKTTSKNVSRNSPNKNKCRSKNFTLTQMFDKQNTEKSLQIAKGKDETDYDSDETYFEADENNEPPSQNMGLTRMLSLINKTDSSMAGSQKPSFDFGDISACTDFECNKKKKKSQKLSLKNGFKEESTAEMKTKSTNLANINEVLAIAQGVPDHQLDAEPIVRGKARKQLPGWACKECEQFYAKQGLTESQVVTLNKCTKHRGVYRPREDTCPGFWDLTMRTQIREQK